MVFHIWNYQFLSISETQLTSIIILFLHTRAQSCFLWDGTSWCQEPRSRTLHEAAVLLLCSSCCQGITLYLHLQLKIDTKLYLDIYVKTFLSLLVLKLTVWIMFYYYNKLTLADKVFIQSLTVCINSSGNTGSSYTDGIAKPWREDNPTAKHRAKLLMFCFSWSDNLLLYLTRTLCGFCEQWREANCKRVLDGLVNSQLHHCSPSVCCMTFYSLANLKPRMLREGNSA